MRTDDVIAAVSSPPGRGVRGIVRLTGPAAVAVADTLFQATDGRPLAEQPAWRILHGFAHVEPDLAVPANAVVFLPPKSYTGQPLVELHLAGSPALLEMALRAAIRAGARLAEPGEFTARAFLAGRMDLLAAEAVAQTIAARSDAQLAASRELGSGRLATFIRAATDELADLLSLVEAGIDFADEAIEFIDAATLAARLAALRAEVADLQARAVDVGRLETLPRVALVGPANAGKSSLLNRLSGLDRSICSPIPGTTRDVLAAIMDTPAGQVMLLDGPGVGPPRNALDELAQRQWRTLLEQVDLVVLVLPADALSVGAPPTGAGSVDLEDSLAASAGRECLVALNKQDLLSTDCQAAVLHWADGRWPGRARLTSAVTGFGCEDLREAVAGAVGATPGVGEGRIVLTARHSQALADALAALDAALEMADRAAGQSELVAVHLREALEALGSITGQVTTEDLLGRVFAGFCIGK